MLYILSVFISCGVLCTSVLCVYSAFCKPLETLYKCVGFFFELKINSTSICVQPTLHVCLFSFFFSSFCSLISIVYSVSSSDLCPLERMNNDGAAEAPVGVSKATSKAKLRTLILAPLLWASNRRFWSNQRGELDRMRKYGRPLCQTHTCTWLRNSKGDDCVMTHSYECPHIDGLFDVCVCVRVSQSCSFWKRAVDFLLLA